MTSFSFRFFFAGHRHADDREVSLSVAPLFSVYTGIHGFGFPPELPVLGGRLKYVVQVTSFFEFFVFLLLFFSDRTKLKVLSVSPY